MSDHCESMTEEGNAVCIPGQCSCSSESKDVQPIQISLPATDTFSIKKIFLKLKTVFKEKKYVEENS